jgi:hypothetical protein
VDTSIELINYLKMVGNNMSSIGNITILDIEKEAGIEGYEVDNESSLSIWYDSVRNKRINELTDGDIARMVRQNLYLKYAVKEAIKRLRKNPIIGELFDGELLAVISRLDNEFWKQNSELSKEAFELVKLINVRTLIPKDFEWLSEDDEDEFYEYGRVIQEKIG